MAKDDDSLSDAEFAKLPEVAWYGKIGRLTEETQDFWMALDPSDPETVADLESHLEGMLSLLRAGPQPTPPVPSLAA